MDVINNTVKLFCTSDITSESGFTNVACVYLISTRSSLLVNDHDVSEYLLVLTLTTRELPDTENSQERHGCRTLNV